MSASRPRTRCVLSIAGSDSGGGAGIQADLKAFACCGVHGMTAITAITAQNTVGVPAIHTVPPEIILAQVRAVLSDIGVDAVKIGMLGAAETVLAVAAALEELPAGTPVVVNPVMVSESGAPLLEPDARAAVLEQILPKATVATPNIPEAEALLAEHEKSVRGPRGRAPGELGRALLELGPRVVVVTGGHGSKGGQAGGSRAGGEVVDVFLDRDGSAPVLIRGERHRGGAAHGSGCTHSSVLAAQLALGRTPLEAAWTARALAGAAVRDGLEELGAGAGPVDVVGLARMRAGAPGSPAAFEGEFAHLP